MAKRPPLRFRDETSTTDKVIIAIAIFVVLVLIVAVIAVLVLAFRLTMNIWAKLPGQLGEKLALVGLLVAVLTLLISTWPLLQQWLLNRYINSYCTAEDYEKEKIIEYAQYYIRPQFTNIDPTGKDDFTTSHYGGDMFKHLDRVCAGGAKFVLILADAGMGKSALVINYFLYNARRKRFWLRRRITVKYLGFGDVIPRLKAIPDNEKSVTTLILDGFDEDPLAADSAHQRLEQILKACIHFKHVVLTCRTQFFQKDSDIPRLFEGYSTPYPRALGESAQIKIAVTYIAPFSDSQIRRYVRKRHRVWQRKERKELYKLVTDIPTLSMRPMVLAYGPELVRKRDSFKFLFQVYTEIIEQWLERERLWVDPEQMVKFSQTLAVQIFRGASAYGGWRMPRKDFTSLLKNFKIAHVDRWKIGNRSLLNRDIEGNLKFAHLTFLEYFVICSYWAGEKSVGNALPIDLSAYERLQNPMARLLLPLLQIESASSDGSSTISWREDELAEMVFKPSVSSLDSYHSRANPDGLAAALEELKCNQILQEWRVHKDRYDNVFTVVYRCKRDADKSWSGAMRQFFVERFYLELERRSQLLESMRSIHTDVWPPRQEDEKLFELFQEGQRLFGPAFSPFRSERPIVHFDFTSCDLGQYDDYRPEWHDRIGWTRKPFHVLVTRKDERQLFARQLLCVTDHDTGLMWREAIVCPTPFAVRRALRSNEGGWRLPSEDELASFLKVRGPFLDEGNAAADYWIEDGSSEILRSQTIRSYSYHSHPPPRSSDTNRYLLAVRKCPQNPSS